MVNKLRCSVAFASDPSCPYFEDKDMKDIESQRHLRVTYCIKHMAASRRFLGGARYQEAEDFGACTVDIGDPIRSQETE